MISLSFANVKDSEYTTARKKICQIVTNLYSDHSYLLNSGILGEKDREFFRRISADMDDMYAAMALHQMSRYLSLYHKKKVIILLDDEATGREEYQLMLTNKEVYLLFDRMIRSWFSQKGSAYNESIRALLHDDRKAMNVYMNKVALATFSSFDTGNHPSEDTEPERFYHGFVLGLMVELSDRYIITSNRESGLGRYDVLLEPRREEDNAMILEFKVHDPDD